MIPELLRAPGWLRRAGPLKARGALAGSPFATLEAALAAVRVPEEAGWVHLVTFTPSGWAAFAYEGAGLFAIDLGSLLLFGLPLGGSASAPQTYLRDARGNLGRIVAGATQGDYDLQPVVGPIAPPVVSQSEFQPFVVPEAMENAGRNVAWRPRFALRPGSNIDVLVRCLQWVSRLPSDIKVKAGGQRHSWSPVNWTDGVYIHPEGMTKVETVDDDAIAEQAPLVAVLAGTRIRDISAALWADGKALPYLGGWDGQTLGGVLPTGTHGSTLLHGPLAEMVRSLDVVRFDGQVVRVEPASRVLTQPQRFHELHPDWNLIQDDEAFNALRISMGSMGVVHRFVIEVRDRFWLNERRTVTTMPVAERTLAEGNIYRLMKSQEVPSWVGPPDDRGFSGHPKPAYHLELLWNPYTDKVVVTTRHSVDEGTRQRFQNGGEPGWFAHPPIRDLFRVLKLSIMRPKYSRPDIPELLTEYFSRAIGRMLELVLSIAPGLIPKLIDNSLKEMRDPTGFTQRSYNVFNIGEGANSIPAQSSTCSVPLHDDRWLDAIGVLREVARAFARQHRAYQTGPISLRFVRGSPIFLADPVDVCKFELIFGGDNERVRALSQRLVREYYLGLYARFGADVRFHWGQLIPGGTLELPTPSGENRVRAGYPLYDDWRRQRVAFDPAGRGLNPWLISVLPRNGDLP